MASEVHELITRFKADLGSFNRDMSNAGNAILGVKGDFKDMAMSADDAEDQMKDVGGAGGDLIGKLKGMAKVMATAFALDKLKDFAIMAMETTAKLNAMDSQFDQVFKDEANAVMVEKLKNLSGDLGIQIDRLTSSANKFGSQFKGAGIETTKAMDMTETATRLAADSAAFYDTSMEDATASVSSFLKGNFEAGDSIGVFTNATQMSVKAQEAFGKSWQDLTEAQKQDLLLQKIEETYTLSGAIGQATRESDSWENVTGNLKATWERFLTIIGNPLLKLVIPIIQTISDGMTWLQGVINSFSWSAFLQANPAIQMIVDSFMALKDAVVNSLGGVWTTAQTVFAEVSRIVTGVLAPVLKVIGALFYGLLETSRVVWNALSDAIGGAFQVIGGLYNTYLKPVINLMIQGLDWLATTSINSFKAIVGWVQANWPAFREIITNVWNGIVTAYNTYLAPILNRVSEKLSEVIAWVRSNWPSFGAIFQSVWQGIQNIYNTYLAPILAGLMTALSGVISWVKANWPAFQTAFQTAWQAVQTAYNTYLKPVVDSLLKAFQGVLAWVQGAWQGFSKSASDPLTSIQTAYNTYLAPTMASIQSGMSAVLNWVITNWPAIRTTISNVFSGIMTAYQTYVAPVVSWLLEKFRLAINFIAENIPLMGTHIRNVFTAIMNLYNTYVAPVVSSLITGFGNVVNWVRTNWPAIQTTMSGVFTAVWNVVQGVVNFFRDYVLPIFTTVVNWVRTNFPLMKEVAVTAFNLIVSSVRIAMDVLKNTIGVVLGAIYISIKTILDSIRIFWSMWGETILNIIRTAFTFIRSTVENVLNVIKGIINIVLGIIKGDWSRVWEGIRTVLSAVWDQMKNIINTAINLIKSIISGAWNAIKVATSIVWNGIKTLIGTVWNNIKTAISTAITNVKTAITNGWNNIKTSTTETWNNIKSKISEVWENIKTAIREKIESAKTTITNVWNNIKTATDNVWNNIRSGITNAWNNISSGITEKINAVKTTISNVWTAVQTTTGNIWNGIKTTITNAINGAKDAVGRAIDTVKGFFNFKFQWPHIPKPSFGITPAGWRAGDLLKGIIPKIGINWNADGAIFNKPTIFGTDQGLQGVGEAGPEAIMPIKKLPSLLEPYFMRKGEATGTTDRLQTVAQSVDLTVRLGDRAFRIFVDDITKAQDREIEAELAYDI